MRRLLFILLLLSPAIVAAQKPAESVVAIKVNSSKFQFVNKQTGLPVDSQLWDETEPFINGFSRVLLNDKISFVNSTGKLIYPVELEDARNFNNHLAAVKKDDKWSFIDESGKLISPFNYEIVFDFEEPVSVAFDKTNWWLISNKGEVIKQLDISVCFGFKNGVAKIIKLDKEGILKTTGEIIFTNSENKINKPTIPYHNNYNPTTPVQCPDNIDFENGSFLNWQCYIGRVDSVGNTNVITVNPSPPTANRHRVYPRANPSAIDPFGLFPLNPPDGSNFAVKLGNAVNGAQAERIRYTIRVPLNDSNFSIRYDYAVVLQDPGHTTWTQPRFNAKLLDSATNTYINCASFEYISTAGLPGFAVSPVDNSVIYKPWSSVFFSFRGQGGKTLYLEFTTADCVRRGHWGYAYVDVEKTCGQSIDMQYDCTSPNITTLTGPPGFQFYNWWNQNFTTLLGTGQQVVLNPGPPVGSVIWLEMVPYNNFGCLDTIKVTISGTFNANFGMSDTVGVCAPHTFTFYNRDIPSTSTLWDFGDGTTGTGDTVTHTFNSPGTYLVKLHVVLPSGCIGEVIKNVSILQPVGSFSFDLEYYCNNQTVRFDAAVNSTDSLVWDFGDGIILRTLQTTVFHNYAAPGIYLPSLTLISNNGCQNTVLATDTVRIEMLAAGYINNDVKICGSTTVNFTDTSYSYFGITIRDWDFGDGTTGTGSNVSHTYTVTGTYNVRLIITGASGCLDTITKPIYVEVHNIPVASIIGDTVRCQQSVVTFNSNVQSVDSINLYSWTSSNGFSGSGTSFTVNFTLPGIFTIQFITRTIYGCFDTATHQITINPTPDVVQPANQTLCNGATTNLISFTGAVSGSTFSWSNNNTSIGLAASGNGDIASFTAINNTNAPVTATISVTPSAAGCPGAPKTFTITVNPTPNVVQPANQTLCNGATTNLISFTGAVSGSTFSWSNNNTSIGLAASGNGDIASFTTINNTNAPVTATISVTPSAAGCPGAPKTFTITVNPTPNVVQPVNQTLCNGATTNLISFTGAVSGSTFSWSNNNTSIGLAASGNGDIASFTAINNTNAPVTATISVTPSAAGCPGAPKTFTITVNPTPNVVQPANQTLCNGATTNLVSFTGAVSGSTFSWSNNNTSIGLAASGNGDIASFTAINNTNAPVTATISVTPSAAGCPGAPKTFTITVNPTPNVVQPANQTLCNGATTNLVSFTGAVSGSTFSWSNNNTSIGLAASGNGDIASFTAINNTNAPVTATISVTPSAAGCPGAPKTFTITVNPTPNVVQPANQTLCNGATTNLISFTGAVSGSTFSWSNNNTSIGLAASGNGDIASFTTINNTNAPVTATISVTPSAAGCPGAPKTFTITVNPTPNVVQPVNQTLCNGATTNLISFTGAVSGSTFSWSNNNTSIGLAASGNGDIASFTAINNTNAPVTATISVTPSAAGCPGAPKTFTITVNPTPNVVQPANQTLCNGATTNLVSFTGAVSGSTFSWSNNNTSIGLAASGNGDIASFTAINNTNAPVTATISVTPSAAGCPGAPKTFTITVNPTPNVVQPVNQTLCNGATTNLISFTGAVSGSTFSWSNNNTSIGLAASGNGDIASFTAINNTNAPVTATISVTPSAAGCPGAPKTFTITVNPTPNVVQPANQTLCNGATTNLVSFTGAVSGSTFSWSNNNTSIGLAASGNGDIASFTAINNTNAPVTATISVTPSAAGCPGAPKTFTITVNPTPNVVQPVNQTLCNGATTNLISFTGAVSGSTFSWSNNNTSIGLAASGNGDIASFTAINNTNASVTATISVTPSAAGCPGAPKTFTITIKPTPNVIQPADQALCNGATTTAVTLTGAVSGTTYSWTNNNPSIGLAANGNGNIPAFRAINTNNTFNTPATATITVIPTAAACTGLPESFTISVNPSPDVLQPANQAICNGITTNLITFAGNLPGTNFNWSNNNPSIGLPASGAGNISAFTAINTTHSPINATITVSPMANSCPGASKTFLITVNPTPSVVASNDMHVCLGNNVQLSASGASQYIWSPIDRLNCSNCPNPISTPVDSIRYTVRGISSFGCEAFDSVTLKVIKPFQMQISPNDTLCFGKTLLLNASGANTYLWTPPQGLNRTNIANPIARPSTTTLYRVVGFDGYNCFTDTNFVTITVGPNPWLNLGPDLNLSTGTVVNFNPVTQNGPIVNWSWTPSTGLSCTNCPTPSLTVKDNIFYTLSITNNYGCVATDTVFIFTFCKSAQVFIPNAFTPDGDGLNDILMIRGKGILVKSFRIFSRWGELVFERTNFNPNDLKYGWDGKVRGIPATTDVFVYTAEVICDNGIIYTYKGNTTLLK